MTIALGVEQPQMLTESYARGPKEPPLRDITLGNLLASAAKTAPNRVALIAGVPERDRRRQWTYAELYSESQRAARALHARFKPGERVAIWAHNIPEWIMAQFGAAMAGVILVTVNPGLRAAEVEYILNQSRSAGILVAREFRDNRMLDVVVGLRAKCRELREVICFDDWDAFLASGDTANHTLPDVKPSDAAMIQYTSGTTGFPKGALLHHRGLVNNGTHMDDRLGLGDGWVKMTMIPLFHTGGCVCCVVGAVSKRMTQVLVEAFEPDLVIELLATYKVNAMLGVPTMLIGIMEDPSFESADFSALKVVYGGGSTVPAPVVTALEQKLGVTFVIAFGQTECSPVCLMTWPNDSVRDKSETLGTPMPHTEVKIVHPETGATLPVGQVGEICTRGYHIMKGYFENAAATKAAIDGDGWMHTGDLGAMDSRGYCTIEGRIKDMINRGGENIYPKEIEELLFRHPSVGDVAVVGLPDPKWGEVVSAFIRPTPGHAVNRDELFEYVREHLAPHKTPRRWFAVEAMPLTGSGKIQKFTLREQWAKGVFREL
jgi:fatty-acyl-CoA synthase